MTFEELKQRQSWSLDQKIDHALGAIEQFYNTLNGQVFISFSGGKDSTVLLHIARRIQPNIKAVFCNTRNEYPEIVNFVRKMKENGGNIDIIQPHLTPKEVIEQYGFPMISKDKAKAIYYAKYHPESKSAQQGLQLENDRTRIPLRYRYLIQENYDVSNKCCDKLKKEPLHEYVLETKTYPILGTLAAESKIREYAYIKKGGCNTFNNRDKRKQKSTPLAIWTEEDIQEYIKRYNVEICDIYNKGLTRTGCAFCLFGAQFKSDNRLQFLYNNYPKFYNMCMNYTNNGTTYREAARKFLKQTNITLPDEQNSLF